MLGWRGILGKSTTRTSILSKGYCSCQCSSTYVSGTVPVGTYLGIPRHHLACVCSSNCTRLRGTNMLVPAQKWNISSIRSRITIASEGGGGDLVYEFMLGVSRPENWGQHNSNIQHDHSLNPRILILTTESGIVVLMGQSLLLLPVITLITILRVPIPNVSTNEVPLCCTHLMGEITFCLDENRNPSLSPKASPLPATKK